MSRARPITDSIKEYEYNLAKYKAVAEAFPDARASYYSDFSSKSVNSKYEKLEFARTFSGLLVLPYCEVKFQVQDKEEIIKVYSQPKSCRLVYLYRWGVYNNPRKKIMKFSRFKFNLKNNIFKDHMVNDCWAEIMKFIGENPGYELDTKHLDPRLKKLLTFI